MRSFSEGPRKAGGLLKIPSYRAGPQHPLLVPLLVDVTLIPSLWLCRVGGKHGLALQHPSLSAERKRLIVSQDGRTRRRYCYL